MFLTTDKPGQPWTPEAFSLAAPSGCRWCETEGCGEHIPTTSPHRHCLSCRTQDKKTCKECGEKFAPKKAGQRFCDRACSAAWLKKARNGLVSSETA